MENRRIVHELTGEYTRFISIPGERYIGVYKVSGNEEAIAAYKEAGDTSYREEEGHPIYLRTLDMSFKPTPIRVFTDGWMIWYK